MSDSAAEEPSGAQELAERARAGDVEAMNQLGNHLSRLGEEGQARFWWKKAADQGLVPALGNLGNSYWAAGEHDEGETILRSAVELGSTESASVLGSILFERSDFESAEPLLQLAAQSGDAEAMFYLSRVFARTGDLSSEAEWTTRAARAGLAEAMYNLAIHLNARGVDSESHVWLLRAAEAHCLEAMTRLGEEYANGGDLDQATLWLGRAADDGDPVAAFRLGRLLEDSGDLVAAERWMMLAADADHAAAVFHLAALCDARMDLDQAEALYRRALALGYDNAMRDLGLISQDRGDIGAAEGWFRRAEEQGVERASESLMSLFETVAESQEFDAVTFETFEWPTRRYRRSLRVWGSPKALLLKLLVRSPPDFRAWDPAGIREELVGATEYVTSLSREQGVIDLAEMGTWPQAAVMSEDVRLLDFDCFAMDQARCVAALYWVRSAGVETYFASTFVLFAKCYWVIKIELPEGGSRRYREAVVRQQLELEKVASSVVSLDALHHSWDGVIPVEDDSLTQIRLLTLRIRESLAFDNSLRSLEIFDSGA